MYNKQEHLYTPREKGRAVKEKKYCYSSIKYKTGAVTNMLAARVRLRYYHLFRMNHSCYAASALRAACQSRQVEAEELRLESPQASARAPS